MGLEGVIAKRQDALYVSGRTDTWLKLKCHQRQEFVIGGFTDRANSSGQLGSLLLGVYDDAGVLVSAGSVGTGFNERDAAAIAKKLSALETKRSPFGAGAAPKRGRWSKRAKGAERWVKPTLVAEVRFVEWTPGGQIRHAAFEGLRADKEPKSIRREQPAKAVVASMPRASGIKVSHGDRVIDASTGLTKLDLVLYYERIAPFILPHLKGRPVSMVRGPNGNTHGATTAAAFSARARPGLGVSMPVAWSALEALTSGDQWNIRTAAGYAESLKANPWASFFATHQSLGEAFDALAFVPPRKR